MPTSYKESISTGLPNTSGIKKLAGASIVLAGASLLSDGDQDLKVPNPTDNNVDNTTFTAKNTRSQVKPVITPGMSMEEYQKVIRELGSKVFDDAEVNSGKKIIAPTAEEVAKYSTSVAPDNPNKLITDPESVLSSIFNDETLKNPDPKELKEALDAMGNMHTPEGQEAFAKAHMELNKEMERIFQEAQIDPKEGNVDKVVEQLASAEEVQKVLAASPELQELIASLEGDISKIITSQNTNTIFTPDAIMTAGIDDKVFSSIMSKLIVAGKSFLEAGVKVLMRYADSPKGIAISLGLIFLTLAGGLGLKQTRALSSKLNGVFWFPMLLTALGYTMYNIAMGPGGGFDKGITLIVLALFGIGSLAVSAILLWGYAAAKLKEKWVETPEDSKIGLMLAASPGALGVSMIANSNMLNNVTGNVPSITACSFGAAVLMGLGTKKLYTFIKERNADPGTTPTTAEAAPGQNGFPPLPPGYSWMQIDGSWHQVPDNPPPCPEPPPLDAYLPAPGYTTPGTQPLPHGYPAPLAQPTPQPGVPLVPLAPVAPAADPSCGTCDAPSPDADGDGECDFCGDPYNDGWGGNLV